MSDVIVVGGGVIGLTIAYEMSQAGAAVTVLDKGQMGAEASWAGAGMLPPGNPAKAKDPFDQLRGHSHLIWRELSEKLRESTGIDNGFRVTGGLFLQPQSAEKVDHGGDLPVDKFQEEGVTVQPLSPQELAALEPALRSPPETKSWYLPELAQVRNPEHLKALVSACSHSGVRLVAGELVENFERVARRVTAVRTATGNVYAADEFVIASGAWSGGLSRQCGRPLPIVPVRGQIVLLSMARLPVRHIIELGREYLVPRPDGRLLIGATEEDAGFLKETTASGVAGLMKFALSLVPHLADAKFEKSWAGLRPGTIDGLPYLGRLPEFANVTMATGHFRGGLQMSPITGRLVRQLLTDQPTTIDLSRFSPTRTTPS